MSDNLDRKKPGRKPGSTHVDETNNKGREMLTENEKIFLDRVAKTMINSGLGEDSIDIACKSVLARDAEIAAAIIENSNVKKTITTIVYNSAQRINMREQHKKQLKDLESSANLRVAEIFI